MALIGRRRSRACGLLGVLAARGEVVALAAEAEHGGPCRTTHVVGQADERPDRCPEIEITLSFASAYVFRGYNVFQETGQFDQSWVAKPRVVWTDPAGRVSIGYSAAYQLTGDNLWENVASGVGSEQVVFADYDFTPMPRVVVSPEVGTYVYPQAQDTPLLVEASAEARYVGPVQVGAFVGYLGAVRPGPLTEDYLYVSPSAETTFDLSRKLAFVVHVSAGVKLFRGDPSHDNTFDVLATESLYYALTDVFYVGAKLAMAWTNLESAPDPVTGRTVDFDFSRECAPFWGFTAGADL
jgi:hypothetical protein